ncbi:glycosyltransferase [Pseudomonas sp. PA-3-11C]|nr:glycosyltransferase [Pseudomonas sp. PA-3-11C]MCF5566480.1 glycosyltransferase [Pseudomonas sp. PA-3-11C]
MHESAMKYGKDFFETYCANDFSGKIIVDVGSQDVNGSLREFCPKDASYIGVDFVEGRGVDVLITDPYHLPFESETVDVVVCSSVFEHSEFFWLLFLECVRIIKPSGLIYFNAPSNGIVHRYPIDSWRFYPDSGLSLVNWSRYNSYNTVLLESFLGAKQGPIVGEGMWNDFVAVILKDQSFASHYPQRIQDLAGVFHCGYNANQEAEVPRYANLPDYSLIIEQRGAIEDFSQSICERDSQIENLSEALIERDSQIGGLTQAVAEREAQIAALSEVVAGRDSQIGGLTQAVAEREAQIAALSEVVAGRDSQIGSLTQAVAEQESQLASLNLDVIKREALVSGVRDTVTTQDGHIRALQETVQAIYQSRSWRVTRMIRYVGRIWRKVGDVRAVVRRLLQGESLLTLVRKVLRVLRREGLRGVRVRVRQQHYLATQTMVSASAVLPLTAPCFALESAVIVRDKGHYALASTPQGYTYVEPQRPVDLESKLAALESPTLFSIVVPIYNTAPELLEAVLNSIQAQWYPHWQLILVDDASPAEETRKALAQINHPLIKVLCLESNQGIAGATNVAIEAAEGDFIVFMDHDDELTVDCLYELMMCIEREQPDFIYSDEDKLTEHGEYSEPHFKPGWSPDTMMSTMFTCHVSCVRRSLLAKVGGLRSQYDGCQDWDFILRVSEQTDRISHIAKVLYHWRIIPASIASDIAAKPYVLEASRRVREDALQRRGLLATVEPLPQMPGYFRVAYQLQGHPLISIIIPTRDNERVLRRCIDSILQRTGYRHFELVILDNGSVEPAAVAYLQQLKDQDDVTVIRHDAPFNFSELNNIGARAATGELLLFLNDDTEVLQEDWLERMGGFARLAHVGAVGAKLLYPGGRQVQHAGILNLEDGPGHAFLLQDCDSPGYYMRNLLEYNWLAVTGACLMVTRNKFNGIDGFSESLPVAYNDIDLCMRLRDAGFYNVVCQAVRLTHHESASRGIDHIDPVKMARLKRELAHLYERNPGYFQHDPFHNPNLHPNGIHFEVPV